MTFSNDLHRMCRHVTTSRFENVHLALGIISSGKLFVRVIRFKGFWRHCVCVEHGTGHSVRVVRRAYMQLQLVSKCDLVRLKIRINHVRRLGLLEVTTSLSFVFFFFYGQRNTIFEL